MSVLIIPLFNLEDSRQKDPFESKTFELVNV